MLSRRAPLLVAAFALMALATAGGLLRLGWSLPAPGGAAMHHGALMVGGFFGTLISLERAVAVRLRWAFGAPMLAAAGGALLVLGAPVVTAQALAAAGAAVLVAASLVVCARLSAPFTWTIAAGAFAWLAGNLAWMASGAADDAVVLCWLGFFVLTIAGERLELSRVSPKPPAAQPIFVTLVAAQCATLAAAVLGQAWAGMAFAVTCVLLALWLLRWDLARRTIRAEGLTRYMAVALLGGHGWLLVGGLLLAWLHAAWPHDTRLHDAWLQLARPAAWAVIPLRDGFALRDAALHALLLGFVFSMVYAHAFAILPSVAAVRLAWRPAAYLPLALLHVSVGMRIVGDLGGPLALRQWGALLSAISLAAFVATVIGCAIVARRSPGRAGPRRPPTPARTPEPARARGR